MNKPLAELLNLMVHRPEDLAEAYVALWCGEAADAQGRFYSVRKQFNRTQDLRPFLYLLARCIKRAARYNSQRPDMRRLGTRPETTREHGDS